MYSTNPSSRIATDGMNGRTSRNGAVAMRAADSEFGRFIARRLSGEGLEHQLADRFQRLEHAVAPDGNRLEVRRALDPLSVGLLVHQVLPRVIRVWHDSLLARFRHFPARV